MAQHRAPSISRTHITATLVGALVAILASALVGTSVAPIVGVATMAPPVCTPYESALLHASAAHGQPLRLACTSTRPV